jgi:putative peptidoglycan lipid II flippase
VLSWLVVVLIAFTVLAEIFMREIMTALAPGVLTKPDLFDACVLFARLTLPYLLCMAVVALLSGVLNTSRKFAMAAAAPALLNLTIILGLLFAIPYFKTAGHMMAWAVAIAGILQYLWLGYACWKAGLKVRLPLPRLTASARRLLRTMIPGIIGGGAAQINIIVGTAIGSFIATAVPVLYYADRIYEFPLSMIGIAIGTALLPELSRRIHGAPETAVPLQNRAVELSLFLALPAAAALIAIAEPICVVMFQYGRFTLEDARHTGWVLAAYATGLPAYVLIRVFVPGFYAREDTRTPVKYAITSVIVNTVLSIVLVWPPFGLPSLSFVGIAVATATAAWVNAILLALGLWSRKHWHVDAQLRRRLPRTLLSTLLMAGALVPLAMWVAPWLQLGLWNRVLALATLVFAGMLAYAIFCLVLRVTTPAELKQSLRRGRAKPGAPPPTGTE